MKRMLLNKMLPVLGLVALIAAATPRTLAFTYAVWLDGSLSDGGNAIPSRLTALGNTVTLVTTAQLETAGFLDSFDAVVVSRFDSSFGSYLSASAAANVAAYVGSGAGQGGVAVFTNDMADNLLGSGSGDPFDPNLDALFVNAATFAASSHHGYIGEFNGAVMAMTSNTVGVPALGLLPGSASPVHGYGPDFTYDFGPIGPGNPIDAGVTFPFTDADHTTFLTDVTGADPSNIVLIYTSDGIKGEPAVLANSFVISGGHPGVPDAASTGFLCVMSLVGLGAFRRWIRR